MIRAFYLVAGIGLGIAGFWATWAWEVVVLLTALALLGYAVALSIRASRWLYDRYRATATQFPNDHPLVSFAFFLAALLMAYFLLALVDPGDIGNPVILLKLAGGLVGLGVLGLLVRYLIEYGWKQKVATLERRVAELEGRQPPPSRFE